MPRLIVVPMDDSEKTECALEVAKSCGSVGRTEVVLVAVPDPACSSPDELRIARHLLELKARGFQARWESIEAHAAALRPDLIICSCRQIGHGINTELDHWQATWPGTPAIVC